MGRRAKYLTLDDKMAALRQQKAAYSRTERGKAARQAQNARAYIKHHRRRGDPMAPTKSADSESEYPERLCEPEPNVPTKPLPNQNAKPLSSQNQNPLPLLNQNANPLPKTILTLASLPLPTSFLFHQALSGSPQINESDLPQWDKPPPYDYPIPPDTHDEAQFTRNLVDVMHGRCLRLEREACVRRKRVFEMGMGEVGIGGLVAEVREAERRVMDCWDEDKLKVDMCVPLSTACERHQVMAKCHWQWQARRIYKYRQEADLLASGQNPYLCVD